MAVGPVDVYIIGFPGNKFSGKIAPAIMELAENGTIRVLDLLFVMKDADGVVTTLEAADIDEEGAAFLAIDVTQPGALGPEDAEEVSDDLPANSCGPADRVREPLGRESGRRSAGCGRRADRLDPDPGRRRGSVRGKLTPPFEIERKRDGTCPYGSPHRGRRGNRHRRVRARAAPSGREVRRAGRAAVAAAAAGARQAPPRRRTTRPRSSRTWRSFTPRACSPTRSSRPPRPRSSESDRTAAR